MSLDLKQSRTSEMKEIQTLDGSRLRTCVAESRSSVPTVLKNDCLGCHKGQRCLFQFIDKTSWSMEEMEETTQ